MKKTNSDKKNFLEFSEVWKFSKVPKFRYFPKVVWKTMFFMFRTHLIHRPFVSNATSCTMQQLLLRYQIPHYDTHHFPVTRILLMSVTMLKGYLKHYACMTSHYSWGYLSTQLNLISSSKVDQLLAISLDYSLQYLVRVTWQHLCHTVLSNVHLKWSQKSKTKKIPVLPKICTETPS